MPVEDPRCLTPRLGGAGPEALWDRQPGFPLRASLPVFFLFVEPFGSREYGDQAPLVASVPL